MNSGESGKGAGRSGRSRNAFALFGSALRERPVRVSSGLLVEYAMFASALMLAGSLLATKVPLGLLDRAFGLRLRERFTDLLARVSPG